MAAASPDAPFLPHDWRERLPPGFRAGIPGSPLTSRQRDMVISALGQAAATEEQKARIMAEGMARLKRLREKKAAAAGALPDAEGAELTGLEEIFAGMMVGGSYRKSRKHRRSAGRSARRTSRAHRKGSRKAHKSRRHSRR